MLLYVERKGYNIPIKFGKVHRKKEHLQERINFVNFEDLPRGT